MMNPQIYISADETTFHLTNGEFSYILHCLPDGHLMHLWSGKAVRPEADYTCFHEVFPRPMTSCPDADSWYSREHTAQECGTFGSSDFRTPAIEITHPDGSTLSDFQLTSWNILDGKPALPGLPAVYCEDSSEAKTLECILTDQKNSLEMVLSYTIFRDHNVIARNTRLINHGDAPVYADTVQSLCLDLPDSDYVWMQFSGAWGRERHLRNRTLEQGIQSVGSRRGHSSHNHNPVVILRREHTDEVQGEALGIALVYSGNFLIQAEVDTYDKTRILAGIHPDGFRWKLEPGEQFPSPEAV
ncbi:glycoside hydrolase family 36 N-terminal domain-containing protein, partial [Faecalibaculum rodentium]|uniref:glycoside hydrolase family 36 N-terminal domain-containing protein n=1 Tax=Faecalibaculum rodentium TaxID=1702221 RepID=UPI0025878FAE